MKNFILSGILLFPFLKEMNAVDPTSNTPAPQPIFWVMVQDSLPPTMFYFVGGGTVFAASAYLMMRNK